MHDRPLKEMSLEITGRCLLSCLHCSSWVEGVSPVDIETGRILSIIDQAHTLGMRRLTLSGGEPLLHPDVGLVVSKAASLQITTLIYTTGVVGTSPIIGVSAYDLAQLKKNGLCGLIFSLYSDDAEVHDRVTCVKGSHAVTLETIRTAQSLGLSVELHCVPMKINIKHVESLLQLADRLAISQVSFLRFVPQGKGTTNRTKLELSPADERHLIQAIQRARSSGRARIRLGCPFNHLCLGDPVSCSAGVNKLLISWDGRFLPCELFKGYAVWPDPAYITTRELREVWMHESLNRLAKSAPRRNCMREALDG